MSALSTPITNQRLITSCNMQYCYNPLVVAFAHLGGGSHCYNWVLSKFDEYRIKKVKTVIQSLFFPVIQSPKGEESQSLGVFTCSILQSFASLKMMFSRHSEALAEESQHIGINLCLFLQSFASLKMMFKGGVLCYQ